MKTKTIYITQNESCWVEYIPGLDEYLPLPLTPKAPMELVIQNVKNRHGKLTKVVLHTDTNLLMVVSN